MVEYPFEKRGDFIWTTSCVIWTTSCALRSLQVVVDLRGA